MIIWCSFWESVDLGVYLINAQIWQTENLYLHFYLDSLHSPATGCRVCVFLSKSIYFICKWLNWMQIKKGGGGWVIHLGGGVWVGRRGNLKSIIYNSCSPRFISTNFILLVSLVYWKPASIYLSQDCCYCSAGCIDFIKYFYMYIMYLYPQKKYF